MTKNTPHLDSIELTACNRFRQCGEGIDAPNRPDGNDALRMAANMRFPRHIDWKESYLVSVERLDADHKHLLGILNDACDACATGSHTRYPSILDELIAYTQAHFESEESYLAGLQYPLLPAHRLEHRQFYEKITGYRQQVGDRNVFYSIELVDLTETIYAWWHHHILEVDRLYRSYVEQLSSGGAC